MEQKKKETRGGARENAGRKKREETVTTSFRVNRAAIQTIRESGFKINEAVNDFVKKIAIDLKKTT